MYILTLNANKLFENIDATSPAFFFKEANLLYQHTLTNIHIATNCCPAKCIGQTLNSIYYFFSNINHSKVDNLCWWGRIRWVRDKVEHGDFTRYSFSCKGTNICCGHVGVINSWKYMENVRFKVIPPSLNRGSKSSDPH